MSKTLGVYSVVKGGYFGTGESRRNSESIINDGEQPSDILLPPGVLVNQNRADIQVEGVAPLLPPGVTVNTATVIDIREQIAQACRTQFQNCAELKDLIDSSTFSYVLTDSIGVQKLYEAKYKINSNGILDVSWTSARQIENNAFHNDDNTVEPLLPIL